jgi:RimJ/RimL family protein N-acetyltransferase
MSATQIRLLVPADTDAYRALRLRGLHECPTAFASSPDEDDGHRLDDSTFGAFRDGALVGVAGVAREAMRKLAHKALLWGVYVAPEQRRGGVARALVTHALAHAFAMPGVRQVNLSVNAANLPAIALYEALGFRPFGIERGYLQIDGVLHDEMHMTLSRPQAPAAPAARP